MRVPNSATRFRPNAEIYKALGLEPPAPGSGGRRGGPNDDARNNNDGARPRQRGKAARTRRPARARIVSPAARTPRAAAGRQGASRQCAGREPAGSDRPGRRSGNVRAAASARRVDADSGGGNNPDFASMTPEQRQAMMERFARKAAAVVAAVAVAAVAIRLRADAARAPAVGASSRPSRRQRRVRRARADKIDDLLGACGADQHSGQPCGPGTRRPRN